MWVREDAVLAFPAYSPLRQDGGRKSGCSGPTPRRALRALRTHWDPSGLFLANHEIKDS
jgi:hypothetical protein